MRIKINLGQVAYHSGGHEVGHVHVLKLRVPGGRNMKDNKFGIILSIEMRWFSDSKV